MLLSPKTFQANHLLTSRTPRPALRVRITASLCVLLLGALSTDYIFIVAQSPSGDDDVVRVVTDLLLFPIRIRDNRGRAVDGLSERDLSLKDDDHATTSLFLTRGAERVALVFALDQSGSLRSIIAQQREAALALFAHFNQRSQVAVLRFTETPSLVASFGRDAEAVRAAFDFRVDNQRTAIFDAATAAIDALNTRPPDRTERRIVILLSDGLDNASKVKASQVINEAIEKHVSFYLIHLPLFEPIDGRLAIRQPAKGFRDLAEKTGGKYFLAGDAKTALSPAKDVDLAPVFQAIEDDLKSQYLLGFYLGGTARDGRRHVFSVSLPAGLEYSVGKLGYSRRHRFSVNMK